MSPKSGWKAYRRYSEQKTSELFTFEGKRKYLTQEEQARFLAAAAQLDRDEVRTFCMTLAYTGCRISEALELSAARVDLSARVLTFRTLKQRGKVKYRSVPAPDELIEALELVLKVRKIQRTKGGGDAALLWTWGCTQATKHICAVMIAAGIEGNHASLKRLRHGFGVRMAQKTRNPRLIQKWLGHSSLDTTAIYMDLVGEEERAEAVNA